MSAWRQNWWDTWSYKSYLFPALHWFSLSAFQLIDANARFKEDIPFSPYSPLCPYINHGLCLNSNLEWEFMVGEFYLEVVWRKFARKIVKSWLVWKFEESWRISYCCIISPYSIFIFGWQFEIFIKQIYLFQFHSLSLHFVNI